MRCAPRILEPANDTALYESTTRVNLNLRHDPQAVRLRPGFRNDTHEGSLLLLLLESRVRSVARQDL